MHSKMSAFSSILWCLLVPLCTVSSGTSKEHVIYTSKYPTNVTQDFLSRYILIYNEEPKTPNIHIGYICGKLYPFIKLLQVRDKQSDSCPCIDYKPPLVSIEEKQN